MNRRSFLAQLLAALAALFAWRPWPSKAIGGIPIEEHASLRARARKVGLWDTMGFDDVRENFFDLTISERPKMKVRGKKRKRQVRIHHNPLVAFAYKPDIWFRSTHA